MDASLSAFAVGYASCHSVVSFGGYVMPFQSGVHLVDGSAVTELVMQ